MNKNFIPLIATLLAITTPLQSVAAGNKTEWTSVVQMTETMRDTKKISVFFLQDCPGTIPPPSTGCIVKKIYQSDKFKNLKLADLDASEVKSSSKWVEIKPFPQLEGIPFGISKAYWGFIFDRKNAEAVDQFRSENGTDDGLIGDSSGHVIFELAVSANKTTSTFHGISQISDGKIGTPSIFTFPYFDRLRDESNPEYQDILGTEYRLMKMKELEITHWKTSEVIAEQAKLLAQNKKDEQEKAAWFKAVNSPKGIKEAQQELSVLFKNWNRLVSMNFRAGGLCSTFANNSAGDILRLSDAYMSITNSPVPKGVPYQVIIRDAETYHGILLNNLRSSGCRT